MSVKSAAGAAQPLNPTQVHWELIQFDWWPEETQSAVDDWLRFSAIVREIRRASPVGLSATLIAAV
jgi:hypothetical protein